MYSTVLIVAAAIGLLPFSAYAGLKPESRVINVAKDGVDTPECVEEGKVSCLTIDYVLHYIADTDWLVRDEVRIVVSNNQSLRKSFPEYSVISKLVAHKMTIVGSGDVVFRCTDEINYNFELYFQQPAYFVDIGLIHMKGLHFEDCNAYDYLRVDSSGGILIGSDDIQDLVLEDCTFTNGGTVVINGQFNNITVDNCTFENLNGTLKPVLLYDAVTPIIVMNNSLVINNFASKDSRSASQRSGMMMIRVTAPDIRSDYPTDYEIMIENCTFTNNTMEGTMLPIITLVPNGHAYSKNITVTVTISYTTFTNNTTPPYMLLDDVYSAEVEVNMINSVFQSTSSLGFPHEFEGLQILQYTSGQSSNVVLTNVIHLNEEKDSAD